MKLHFYRNKRNCVVKIAYQVLPVNADWYVVLVFKAVASWLPAINMSHTITLER